MFAKKLENEIKEEFLKIAKNISIIKNNLALCEPQLKDFLQVYWVAKEINNNEFNYQEIERLLGAVKNIRTFKQFAETGRKCSLCGERNALFIGKSDNKPAFTENAIEIEEFEVNPKEGLCAVCATKRFYKNIDSFPSTAEIAQIDIKSELENSNDFKTFKNIFTSSFDYQLLYKENHTQKYFEKHGIKLNKGGFEFLKEIYKKISFPNKQKKYYALIQFDGDNMGKLMSGDLLVDKNLFSKTFQSSVSKLLSNYTLWAKDFVNGINEDKIQKGQTVYAGGDDFLAFLNLEYLFNVISKLRSEFEIQVNTEIQKQYKLINNFSFSAGICIAHYKTPLHNVLDFTRKMEKKAKKVEGKDAFAIAVLKHSGEMHQTTIKWKNGENADVLKFITDNLKNDNFSTTFITNFEREFLSLMNEKGEYFENHILKTELNRLLMRSAKKELKKEEKKSISDEMCNKILSLRNGYKLNDLLNLLNICDFIVRKTY